MYVIQWARSVKGDLVRLQDQTGIPALWAAAQMVHESAIRGGMEMSTLATQHHNYAGLKWAEWERAYGCKPVSMGTWEVIDGARVDLSAAFCSCPSWTTWLEVYAALLTGSHYSPALQYRRDPMLYGVHVWRLGWATDQNYITSVAGWMSRLYPTYEDTLPGSEHKTVTVMVNGAVVECNARLEDGKTRLDGRPLAEAMGGRVGWDGKSRTMLVTTTAAGRNSGALKT